LPPGGTDEGRTAQAAHVVIQYDQLVATSTTKVTASPATPVVGQPVTYTATVSSNYTSDALGGNAPAATSPTGTVTFTDGTGTVCSDVALSTAATSDPPPSPGAAPPATATCSQTYQGAGGQTVTATYNGDDFVSGSQGQLPVTVGQTAQTLSFTPGTVPDTEEYQRSFTPAATSDVAGMTPVITVAGACSIDQSTGKVTMTSGTGTCTVYADQPGDASYSPAPEINKAVTATKAPLSVGPYDVQMTYGGAVAPWLYLVSGLVGSDTADTIGGSCGATVAGSPVSSATPAGTYPGVISCSGVSTVNYDVSYGTALLRVNQAATATAVGASANPSPQGQAVTFTATVTAQAPGGGTPAGTVNLYDGATKLGTATLSNGQATLSTNSLSLGSHSITATYVGNNNYQASPPSAPLTENVDTNLSGYPSLTNANLAGAYLANATLAGRDLTSANLSGATLTGAHLDGANLTSANLKTAKLADADLTNATLTATNFKGATGLATATLTGATWSQTNCPDNTLSNNDGGSCAPNHLNP
jgi:hypothetical protein